MALAPALAHDGEAHGSPAPVVSAGSAQLAIGGHSTSLEGVLKYLPFEVGEKVDLTFYLLSMADNRGVGGATVKGTMSSGSTSTDVEFRAKADGPAGAYSGSVTVSEAKTMSWLFDVTVGDDSDLIALGGFEAGRPHAGASVESAQHTGTATIPPMAFAATFGGALVLAVAAFVFGRISVRKEASA